MTLNLKDIMEKGVCIVCLRYRNNLMPLSVKEHNIFKYIHFNLISELTEVLLCRYCYSEVKHLSKFCQLAQDSFKTISTFIKEANLNIPDSNKSILLNIEETISPFLLLEDEELANKKIKETTPKHILCLTPKSNQNYELSIKKEYDPNRSDKVKRNTHSSETYFSDSDDLLLSDLQQTLKKDANVSHSGEDVEIIKNEEIANKLHKRETKKILAQKLYIDEITMLRQRASARSSKWFIMAQYKCEDCIIGYYSEKLLNEHNLLKHNLQNEYMCKICKVRYKDKITLAKHVPSHYLRLGCTACSQTYRHQRDLQRHYAKVHITIHYKCHQCPAVFTTQPSLLYHRLCEHREKPYCEKCNKQFRNKTTFKRHMLTHTGMPSFTCKVCNKTYRGKIGYLTHVKSHGPPSELAYCPLCNAQFKNTCQYRRHCKISQRHLAKNDDTASCGYKCVDCQKIFAASNVLKQHRESVHLKLKRHHCTVCGKNYASPASLWTHKKVHHERKEIPKDKVCEKCGKGFKTNASLMAHLRVHSTEKAFACGTCDASFKHNSGRYMHMRLVHRRPPDKGTLQHTPLRTDLPIKCKHCPATFQHSSGAYIHTRLVHKKGAKKTDQEETSQN